MFCLDGRQVYTFKRAPPTKLDASSSRLDINALKNQAKNSEYYVRHSALQGKRLFMANEDILNRANPNSPKPVRNIANHDFNRKIDHTSTVPIRSRP
jgi:hypothetical protein